MNYEDNDRKRAGRFTAWGLVVLVLAAGLLFWVYREKNDVAGIEPAAGEIQLESSADLENVPLRDDQ